ncbi:MAG: hypothetical protein JNM84_13555 [Planctomycetes bacterium]|nr:hypothetical protein [Planctomycetota bacterium]
MTRSLLLGLPALTVLLAFAPSAPRPDRATRAPAATRALATDAASCADCHAEIQREWASSLHGTAWTNESYQRALKRRKGAQRDACLPCHVPQPLGAAQLEAQEGERAAAPQARTVDLHAGVDCATCHRADDGAMLGPFGGPSSAHASRQDARFDPARVDRLCLACHATEIGPVLPLGQDFLSAPAREPAASCGGCHMPAVERAMATAATGEPAPPVRQGRSHALRGARDAGLLAETLDFELERLASGALALRVKNTGAAHRTPGLVGRKWQIDLELAPASATPPGAKAPKPRKASFEIRHDEALLPLAERSFEIDARELAGPLVAKVRASYRLEGKESIALPFRELELR